jgi:putative DNA primase/helicase
LLIEPGYDPVTKLYYKPGSDVGLPPIPERPTKEQAESTLRLLSSLLDGFPFDGEGNKVQKRSVSRSVALAGIMTTVLRGAFRATPIFLFLAPEPGTGKTFLVKVISYIATGRAVPGSTGCENKEEMDKRLTADVREAPPILHLNNINFDIESPLLSEITTEGIAKIRPLGKTERVPCDCTGMTVFINGNNIRVVGELVRRTLVSMIDAKMERPETRTFDFDPIELVQKDRGAYLAAVFTIARAYMAAGCPEVKGETLAGYEQWSKLVQHPLIWLGMDDPLLSTDEARKLDPEREGLRARIDALVNCFGVEKEFTASEINQTATELQTDGLLGQHRFRHPDLLDAFSREGKPMSSKTIGNQLMKDRERRSNNYYIAIATESGKTRNSYKIVDTDLERAKRGETM